jgi:hypothetical protein
VLAALRRDTASQLAADFVAGRRAIARELLLERSRPDLVVDQIDFAVRFGLPLQYQARLVEAVAAVRLDDVVELIAGELAIDKQVLGVYGSRDAIAAAKVGASRTIEPAPPEPEPEPEPDFQPEPEPVAPGVPSAPVPDPEPEETGQQPGDAL